MARYIDYRVVLLAVFFALLATVGFSLPLGAGLLALAGTLVVGTAATALSGPARQALPAPAAPSGSRQAQLLATIDATVADLERLSCGDLVPAVRPQAEEAAMLATSARTTARAVAAAADQLHEAAQQLQDTGRTGSTRGAGAVGRLRSRQDELVQRLSSTADQLLDVYTNLVETNATLATSTLVGSGEEQALGTVSTSLDDLRVIAAELADTGRQQLPP